MTLTCVQIQSTVYRNDFHVITKKGKTHFRYSWCIKGGLDDETVSGAAWLSSGQSDTRQCYCRRTRRVVSATAWTQWGVFCHWWWWSSLPVLRQVSITIFQVHLVNMRCLNFWCLSSVFYMLVFCTAMCI